MRVPWLLLTVAALVLGCGGGPTDEDLEAIQEAGREFHDRFDIRAGRDVYLEARYLSEGCPPESESRPLYEALLLDSDASPRQDTSFVYLNLASRDGSFCYQLFYEPSAGRVERGEQPFY